MLHLESRDIVVDLLDPANPAETVRQGTRYCWGGYVWQVHDRVAGPLVSGPEWPEPAPSAFNGQGLPESFRHRTRDGTPLTWTGETGLGVGIGTLTAHEKDAVVLAEPCRWTITQQPGQAIFQTRQAAAGFSYELTRKVELNGRTLNSFNELTNAGEHQLNLQWFAHPFFALTNGRAEAELPAGTQLPENPGFGLNERMLTFKRRFSGKDDGQFVLLGLPPGKPLRARLSHPHLSGVEFWTSVSPDECPIWGNGQTFSIEPYLTLALQPGQTRQWSSHFAFGHVK